MLSRLCVIDEQRLSVVDNLLSSRSASSSRVVGESVRGNGSSNGFVIGRTSGGVCEIDSIVKEEVREEDEDEEEEEAAEVLRARRKRGTKKVIEIITVFSKMTMLRANFCCV
jgi:hypothetical protein